jgi:hypothetical protein
VNAGRDGTRCFIERRPRNIRSGHFWTNRTGAGRDHSNRDPQCLDLSVTSVASCSNLDHFLSPRGEGMTRRAGWDTMIHRAQTGKYPVRTLSGMFGTGWSGEAERPGTGTRDRDSRWKEIGRRVGTRTLMLVQSPRSKVESHGIAILTLDFGARDLGLTSGRDSNAGTGLPFNRAGTALRLPV